MQRRKALRKVKPKAKRNTGRRDKVPTLCIDPGEIADVLNDALAVVMDISHRLDALEGRNKRSIEDHFDRNVELEQFLATAAAENPNRRLRMMALSDRVSMTVERADFDDLVTLVIQGATWDKDRVQGARILLRAIGEGKADAPEQILARWTWKLARATRKVQDRRASGEFPEASAGASP